MRICAPLNNDITPSLQYIEVATSFQLPSFQIIGLPSPEVAEARERIRSAIEASGIEFPRKRVIVNLSPASVRKRGTGLDLAMALAILAHGKNQQIYLGAWGELGLDGVVKPAGQITRTLYAAWQNKLSHLILSSLELEEAVEALEVIHKSGEFNDTPPRLLSVKTLTEAWQLLSGKNFLSAQCSLLNITNLNNPKPERFHLESVAAPLLPLPASLERMVGVSAAGHHHFLILGPRGTGKSQALEWLITLQPPSSAQERLENLLLSELGSKSGARNRASDQDFVPVRRVSSQVKPGALVGGAYSLFIRPGEFSLAHGGILIADELPEWHRDSRECFREPLERGRITLTRAQGSLELPTRFVFAGTGNLCACGGWPAQLPVAEEEGQTQRVLPPCKCTYSSRRQYLSRLSGPFLDRVDLVVVISRPSFPETQEAVPAERIHILKKKVRATRKKLMEQWGKPPGLLSGYEIEALLKEHPHWLSRFSDLRWDSLRSRHKMVRLGLTLSVWDEVQEPSAAHFMEASYYRPENFLFLE